MLLGISLKEKIAKDDRGKGKERVQTQEEVVYTL